MLDTLYVILQHACCATCAVWKFNAKQNTSYIWTQTNCTSDEGVPGFFYYPVDMNRFGASTEKTYALA